MTTIYGTKRKSPFPSFAAPSLMTAIVLAFMVLPALVVGGFSIVSHVAQSWTGTGTVLEQGEIPAAKGSFLNCGMIGVNGPCFFQDSSSSESWFVKVRDSGGAEHRFSVSKEQYDSAKVGQSFTKS